MKITLIVIILLFLFDFIFLFNYCVYNYARHCNKTKQEAKKYMFNCIKKFFKKGIK